MTGVEIKKSLKAMQKNGANIYKISVTIAEYEGEWDVYANTWYFDRWGNENFKDFTLDTVEDMKTAERKGKRLATTLANNGFKAKYEGEENC
jgi:hypothetical protein